MGYFGSKYYFRLDDYSIDDYYLYFQLTSDYLVYQIESDIDEYSESNMIN